MKSFSLLLFISNIVTIAYAQNVAIIDQGKNTLSIYVTSADNFFTRQYCFSNLSSSNYYYAIQWYNQER